MFCNDCALMVLAVEYEGYCARRVSHSTMQHKARNFTKVFIVLAAFGVQRFVTRDKENGTYHS